eukprot:gb/GECG01003047.1/.p1 GENE.gb/GECG01003047.1/~~gb/GECG01003047.1/.p1  ORF type:complete len:1241 (+),score=257.34 gb/GECG01003047.1/:1-3723(+)
MEEKQRYQRESIPDTRSRNVEQSYFQEGEGRNLARDNLRRRQQTAYDAALRLQAENRRKQEAVDLMSEADSQRGVFGDTEHQRQQERIRAQQRKQHAVEQHYTQWMKETANKAQQKTRGTNEYRKREFSRPHDKDMPDYRHSTLKDGNIWPGNATDLYEKHESARYATAAGMKIPADLYGETHSGSWEDRNRDSTPIHAERALPLGEQEKQKQRAWQLQVQQRQAAIEEQYRKWMQHNSPTRSNQVSKGVLAPSAEHKTPSENTIGNPCNSHSRHATDVHFGMSDGEKEGQKRQQAELSKILQQQIEEKKEEERLRKQKEMEESEKEERKVQQEQEELRRKQERELEEERKKEEQEAHAAELRQQIDEKKRREQKEKEKEAEADRREEERYQQQLKQLEDGGGRKAPIEHPLSNATQEESVKSTPSDAKPQHREMEDAGESTWEVKHSPMEEALPVGAQNRSDLFGGPEDVSNDNVGSLTRPNVRQSGIDEKGNVSHPTATSAPSLSPYDSPPTLSGSYFWNEHSLARPPAPGNINSVNTDGAHSGVSVPATVHSPYSTKPSLNRMETSLQGDSNFFTAGSLEAFHQMGVDVHDRGYVVGDGESASPTGDDDFSVAASLETHSKLLHQNIFESVDSSVEDEDDDEERMDDNTVSSIAEESAKQARDASQAELTPVESVNDGEEHEDERFNEELVPEKQLYAQLWSESESDSDGDHDGKEAVSHKETKTFNSDATTPKLQDNGSQSTRRTKSSTGDEKMRQISQTLATSSAQEDAAVGRASSSTAPTDVVQEPVTSTGNTEKTTHATDSNGSARREGSASDILKYSYSLSDDGADEAPPKENEEPGAQQRSVQQRSESPTDFDQLSPYGPQLVKESLKQEQAASSSHALTVQDATHMEIVPSHENRNPRVSVASRATDSSICSSVEDERYKSIHNKNQQRLKKLQELESMLFRKGDLHKSYEPTEDEAWNESLIDSMLEEFAKRNDNLDDSFWSSPSSSPQRRKSPSGTTSPKKHNFIPEAEHPSNRYRNQVAGSSSANSGIEVSQHRGTSWNPVSQGTVDFRGGAGQAPIGGQAVGNSLQSWSQPQGSYGATSGFQGPVQPYMGMGAMAMPPHQYPPMGMAPPYFPMPPANAGAGWQMPQMYGYPPPVQQQPYYPGNSYGFGYPQANLMGPMQDGPTRPEVGQVYNQSSSHSHPDNSNGIAASTDAGGKSYVLGSSEQNAESRGSARTYNLQDESDTTWL